jgi:hypothetical protein
MRANVGGTPMAKAPKMHRAPWSAADIKALKALSKQKLGLEAIAKRLQRSPWSVRNRAYSEGLSLSTR